MVQLCAITPSFGLTNSGVIARVNGRPYVAARSLPDVIEAMPDEWLTAWHPAG
jgi:hypothetical protein